jgi:hypothetical protein
MPSINRSTYIRHQQRGTMPGGYGMQQMPGGGRAVIEFDNITGLQRRVGNRPEYGGLVRQGCRPTGERTGPPGFESDVYDCPGTMVGQPVWSQPGRQRETVFGSVSFQGTLVPLAAAAAVGAALFFGAKWLLGSPLEGNPCPWDAAWDHLQRAEWHSEHRDLARAKEHLEAAWGYLPQVEHRGRQAVLREKLADVDGRLF